ncbi:hypothetical protein [Tuwongella immobilis]|uniref:Uncharacterized protein n=1 Tax=Tuwongella immobilis TaxID=692036 RepID=A0A6C2YVX5_9BACT|nr:hypothetical protein [Tuwongella immobilis]VIP05666.1 unnamed protein product [Tuwongella immobilis]VTS08688.1 unnamed protein product [Tuwongella immobilis]
MPPTNPTRATNPTGMAKPDARHRMTWGRRFRFLSRFFGLTALLFAGAGGILASTLPVQANMQSLIDAWSGNFGLLGQFTAGLISVAAVLLAQSLIVEIVTAFWLAAGRRSAVGTMVSLQVLLATTLLIGVNLYSLQHSERFDITRDQRFTLPESLVEQLRQLKTPTQIIVLQQHKTFGRLSEKPDAYDYAAERKVVEKVRDLVELFRAFGPQFQVTVLDVEEEGYDAKLKQLTANAPKLRAAMDAAPENSIFFHAQEPLTKLERVQRLSFNEFYALDKTASKAANQGQGNLVLLPQGVEAFARKVLAIEEKRPRVAIAVIHEFLTTAEAEGNEQFTAAGLRKSLEAYGFDVTDIILRRKWEEADEPEPTAYTTAESKLDTLEEEVALLSEQLREQRSAITQAKSIIAKLQASTPAQLDAEFPLQGGERWSDAIRQEELDTLNQAIRQLEPSAARLERDLAKSESDLKSIYGNERALEDRRVTDVEAKFKRLLSDVDLLIVPRQTLINLSIRFAISPTLHRMNQAQVNAVKAFLESGKPVLACLGPTNEASGPAMQPVDDLESMLTRMGVELGKQTILFDREMRGFAERRGGRTLGAGPRDVPPLQLPHRDDVAPKPLNPIAQSLETIARSVEENLDLRLAHPRPVYLSESVQAMLPYSGVFLLSDSESWNEERPFPGLQRLNRNDPNSPVVMTGIPKFEETKRDDPRYRTRDAERRGPFPVGVALTAKLPADWFDRRFTLGESLGIVGGAATLPMLDQQADQFARPSSRVAVFGHGGIFTGSTLKPAQEQLLLTTCNWLLGREERLPQAVESPWSYPRVELSEQQAALWHWGTFLGLPALVAYVGVIMLMFRRVR